MRPCDLFALPTIDEEDWTWSPSVAVMFGDEAAPFGGHDVGVLPLRILTKVRADDLDHGPGSTVAWQVLTWRDAPLGVVTRSENTTVRVGTAPDLHGEAFLALMGLTMPRLDDDVADPGDDIADLGIAGGQVLTLDVGTPRTVPRHLCVGKVPAVDPDLLMARLGEARGAPCAMESARSIGRGALRDVVLASANTGLRRAVEYDEARVMEVFPSLEGGWLGPVVATETATYLLCVSPYRLAIPVTRALEVRRIGTQAAFEGLARGDVLVPGEEAGRAPPRP